MSIFESQPVETAIGLILLFFVVALAASSLVELISQVFKIRGNDLEDTLGQMLAGRSPTVPTKVERLSAAERRHVNVDDTRTSGPLSPAERDMLGSLPEYKSAEAIDDALHSFKGTSVYEAASAGARRGRDRGKPSYMAARSFANGVVEMLGDIRTPGTVVSEADFALVPAGLRRRVSHLAAEAEATGNDAKQQATAIRAGLEQWFDDTMDRAEGAYRRWTKTWIFVIGLVLAVTANASAFHVADRLWHDPVTRSAVVSTAGRTASSNTSPSDDVKTVADATNKLNELRLPVGWDHESRDAWNDVADFKTHEPWGMALGWLVTALLVTLGAPFWFGLLTQLVSLRSTGAKPPPATNDPGSATSLQSAVASTSTPAPVGLTIGSAPEPLGTQAAPRGAPPPEGAHDAHDAPRRTIARAFGIPTT